MSPPGAGLEGVGPSVRSCGSPPGSRDIGVLLELEGPGIAAVRAPGLDVYQSGEPGRLRIIGAGSIRAGPLVQFRVPDRAERSGLRPAP